MAKEKTSQVDIRKDDYATNKVLAVFSVCLIGVIILMVLQRLLNYGSTFLMGIFLCKVLIVLAAVVVVWGAVLFWMERFRGRNAQYRILSGRNILLVGIVSVLMLTAVNYFGAVVMKPFYVLLPALAIYYLVFHSYAREFFFIAMDAGVALAACWVMHRWLVNGHSMTRSYIVLAILVVLTIVQILLVLRHQKKKKSDKALMLSKNAYLMLKITPVVLLAVNVVSALVGGSVYVACMAIICAYVFAATVYYTVKLM